MQPQDHYSGIPDPTKTLPGEMGFIEPPPAPKPHRVPGDGSRPIPSYLDFSAIVNMIARTYPTNSDEALRHSKENALALRRDPIVMGSLQQRYLPTVQLPWTIVPENAEDQAQVAAAKWVETLISRTPRFQQFKRSLLEAIYYGKYACQVSYKWCFVDGRRGMQVASWTPINGDKLVHRWNGDIGVRVHPLFEGKKDLTPFGWAHFLEGQERQQLVYHVHEIQDADFDEPQMSGTINGTGVRNVIYYFWFLRSQTMQFMMDYLERIGAGGLTIYYYLQGDDQSKADVTDAAQNQFKNNVILFPRGRKEETGGAGIERIEPSNSGADLLKSLVTEYFDREMRRFILGQDLTTTAVPAGSDTAELHSLTLSRIIAYDAQNLADSLTQDLVAPIQMFSCPPEIPPLKFQFNIDKYSSAELVKNAQIIHQMGGGISEKQLMNAAGLSMPKPGDPVLKQIAPMSPEGMGAEGLDDGGGEPEENFESER